MGSELQILRDMGCDVDNVRFRVKIKRDFGNGKGFLIDGRWVKTGYVVTAFGCNVIPGAGWFETVADAMLGIKALLQSWRTGESFHKLYRELLGQQPPEVQPCDCCGGHNIVTTCGGLVDECKDCGAGRA